MYQFSNLDIPKWLKKDLAAEIIADLIHHTSKQLYKNHQDIRSIFSETLLPVYLQERKCMYLGNLPLIEKIIFQYGPIIKGKYTNSIATPRSASDFKLDEQEHERIYQLLQYYEIEYDTTPVRQPIAVILGGQPGSGKSGLMECSAKEFPDRNVVILNGDDYRSAHPESDTIIQLYEKDYAKLTDLEVREWTRRLFEYAISTRRNIIFEGTMRNDGPICQTIQHLLEVGYQVKIRVMAIPEKKSSRGIQERYHLQKKFKGHGRITPQPSHDAAYNGMLQTLQRIEDEVLFHSLQVYNDQYEVIYENKYGYHQELTQSGVIQAIQKERNDI